MSKFGERSGRIQKQWGINPPTLVPGSQNERTNGKAILRPWRKGRRMKTPMENESFRRGTRVEGTKMRNRSSNPGARVLEDRKNHIQVYDYLRSACVIMHVNTIEDIHMYTYVLKVCKSGNVNEAVYDMIRFSNLHICNFSNQSNNVDAVRGTGSECNCTQS
jgi:hypothetical protein